MNLIKVIHLYVTCRLHQFKSFNIMVLIDHLTHYTWCSQIDKSNSVMNMIGNFSGFFCSGVS